MLDGNEVLLNLSGTERVTSHKVSVYVSERSSAVSYGLSLYLHNNQLHCFKLKRIGDKVSGGKKAN